MAIADSASIRADSPGMFWMRRLERQLGQVAPEMQVVQSAARRMTAAPDIKSTGCTACLSECCAALHHVGSRFYEVGKDWLPPEELEFSSNCSHAEHPISLLCQDFYNVDKDDPMGHRAAFFYGPMMQGRDGIGACPCVGTGVIFRREALISIGGQAFGSITEDYNSAMTLMGAGNSSRTVLPSSSFAAEPVRWIDADGFDARLIPGLVSDFLPTWQSVVVNLIIC